MSPAPSTLHAVSVDIAECRENERRRIEVKMHDGWGRAYARQNQLLPYSGTSLTPGEVLRLKALLDDACSNQLRKHDDGPALLSAMLTTGRSTALLATVRIEGHRPSGWRPLGPSLVLGDQWTWWLPPGEPVTPQLRNRASRTQTISRPALMPFPCSARTRLLLEARGVTARIGSELFPASSAALTTALRLTMRKAKVAAAPVMVERWLFHLLANMPGGDVAIASIVTGHRPPVARTVVQYTMLDGGYLPDWLAAALSGFDECEVICAERERVDLGSRYAPSLQEAQKLTTLLGAELEAARRSGDLAAIHNAVTVYTAMFVLLATGCRPTSALIPDHDAIDAATGFQIVDDKPTLDNFKSRLIWVSDKCRMQLGFYHEHLGQLRNRHPGLADADCQTPFTIEACGRMEPLTPARLAKRLRALDWDFPLNAGRHLLRSHLVGRLPSETLHALLGHWHLGTDPWSEKAGLDPLRYRADLAGALPALLQKVGFVPRRGLARRGA